MGHTHIIQRSALAATLFFSMPVLADDLSLRTRLSRDARQLVVTLRNPANKECGGKFLVSDSPRRVEESSAASTLAPFTGSRSATVARLSRISGRSNQAWVTARVNCVDNTSYSRRTRVSIPSTHSRTGLSLNQWIGRVRKQVTRQLSKDEHTQAIFPPTISLVPAFPFLDFSGLVDLQDPNDGSGRLFVAEQSGTIRSFQNNESSNSSELLLDISSRILSGGERGLLGMAIDPRFRRNHFIYVNYTRSGDGATVIARYTIPDSGQADPASEKILLTVPQPFSNHNGGSLQFGPDGFLYIALGDGGSGGDPQGNGQSLTTLLGKILRIDVHRTQRGLNYAIPSTNPFARNRSGFRREIFAYGFRNPWRTSFDFPAGLFWAADVGQGSREEVDLVQTGKNYGWNTMEGAGCYPSGSNCSQNGLTLPVVDYDHTQGSSITGGYTFRSPRLPELRGIYFYGDFVSGTLWGIRGTNPLEQSKLLETSLSISSFGRSADGEVFVLDYSGMIYKFQG